MAIKKIQTDQYRKGDGAHRVLLLRESGLWHDADMSHKKKKMSRFDRVALEIAEGVANIPIEGKKEALHLLREIENKKKVPERTKVLSAKVSEEVKKKTSRRKKSDKRK